MAFRFSVGGKVVEIGIFAAKKHNRRTRPDLTPDCASMLENFNAGRYRGVEIPFLVFGGQIKIVAVFSLDADVGVQLRKNIRAVSNRVTAHIKATMIIGKINQRKLVMINPF